MTQRRRKRTDPQPTTASDAAPIPKNWSRQFRAGVEGGGQFVLYEDRDQGRLVIVYEAPAGGKQLDEPVRATLRKNEFAEDGERTGTWVRPLDREAVFQDQIDAERIMLAIAEQMRSREESGKGPGGRGGKGSR